MGAGARAFALTERDVTFRVDARKDVVGFLVSGRLKSSSGQMVPLNEDE
jgi:hypothetical protein